MQSGSEVTQKYGLMFIFLRVVNAYNSRKKTCLMNHLFVLLNPFSKDIHDVALSVELLRSNKTVQLKRTI